MAWRALLTFPLVPSCGAAERSISIYQAKRGISAASVAFGCTSIVIRAENIQNRKRRIALVRKLDTDELAPPNGVFLSAKRPALNRSPAILNLIQEGTHASH